MFAVRSCAVVLGFLLTCASANAAPIGAVTETSARFRGMETSAPTFTSAQNRAGKTLVGVLQPAGFAVAPVPSVGLGLGYYIDSNSVVQLEGSLGRLRPENRFDVTVGTVAVNLKHFVSETFYLKGGAAYRQTTLSNLTCRDCGPGVTRDWGAARTIDGEFAIGNQWQWENLTLGADWLGLMVPTVRIDDSVTDAFGLSSNENRQANEVWDVITKSAGVSVARVYVGASF